ncbi:MAG: hypothetical protein M1829_001071 [Trizodia sp. TS-e1964]|nr:MAG: hypothetical protein M1829_001071 [Trizodia sp. TS-e1964]
MHFFTSILILVLAPFAFSHSWVEQLTVIAPNGSYVGAPGFPRGNVLRTDPGFGDPSMVNLIPPNGRANKILPTDLMCKSTQQIGTQTKASPRLQAAPGDFVALRYQENGHVTLPQNQPGKPSNRGTVYIYGTTNPSNSDTLLGIHQVWNAAGTGGDKRGVLLATQNYDDGQCYQVNGATISATRQKDFPHPFDPLMGANLWCQNNIILPQDAPSGKPYTLYWVWDWPTAPGADPGLPNGKTEVYTTCMDVDITGSKSSLTGTKVSISQKQQNAVDIGKSGIPVLMAGPNSASQAPQPPSRASSSSAHPSSSPATAAHSSTSAPATVTVTAPCSCCTPKPPQGTFTALAGQRLTTYTLTYTSSSEVVATSSAISSFSKGKRRLSPSPSPKPKRPPPRRSSRQKPSLFETLEAPPKSSPTLEGNKAFLKSHDEQQAEIEGDSSLSDIDSSDLDALRTGKVKRRKKATQPPADGPDHADDDADEEEIDWEDAIIPNLSEPPTPGAVSSAFVSGDLELTLSKDARLSLTNPHGTQKGPSKIERQIRMQTHRMHVQFLLFHNLVRNIWVCDKKTQKILVAHLPPGVMKELERWRKDSGMLSKASLKKKGDEEIEDTDKNLEDDPEEGSEEGSEDDSKEKSTAYKGKGRGKMAKRVMSTRSRLDWGDSAAKAEAARTANLSHGDPLIRFLRYISAFWKKRFTITAPSLRKQGYKPPSVLEQDILSFQNDTHDATIHGEKIKDIEDFREHARKCEGSRDVGAQLFTALLHGLGFEARLVASLQPVGFGWSKTEDAVKNSSNLTGNPTILKSEGETRSGVKKLSEDELSTNEEDPTDDSDTEKSTKERVLKSHFSRHRGKTAKNVKSKRKSLTKGESSDDDLSVLEISPSKTAKTQIFDQDLNFPTYWTEVISPTTNQVFSVDTLVTGKLAYSPESRLLFEPRGAKADKARQVIAYVVAYSSDGTAKDVTVRYLKRNMWPGRTRSYRVPVVKVPVYSSKGKLKRYEDFDWFKNVLSGYQRAENTWFDDLENERDLKPVTIVRKVSHGDETLQGYKNSIEFVLERHLRREEAILPGAVHVKTFSTGKGAKAKDEKVFLRKDVVSCKSSESWHKEGLGIKEGEQPLKMVPMRAVTLNRKRAIEQAEADGGEKMKQGLYSREQTDYIIPPPIKNGKIPKNAYGNMDCFVPSMIPAGAVHVPLRSTSRICRKLHIDYAEAVVGFDFKSQRAVPLIQGVVIAAENEELLIETWEAEEEERKRKEDGKREKVALAMWRKFLMGLRIVKRVREEYGGDHNEELADAVNPFTNRGRKAQVKDDMPIGDELGGGGFLPEDDEHAGAGGFFQPGRDEEEVPNGDLTVEDETAPEAKRPSLTNSRAPISLASLHQMAANDEHDSSNDADNYDESKVADMAGPRTKRRASKGAPKNLAATTLRGSAKAKPKSKPNAKPTPRKRKRKPSYEEEETEVVEETEETDHHSESPLSSLAPSYASSRKESSSAPNPQAPLAAAPGPEPRRKQPARGSAASTTVRSRFFNPENTDGETKNSKVLGRGKGEWRSDSVSVVVWRKAGDEGVEIGGVEREGEERAEEDEVDGEEDQEVKGKKAAVKSRRGTRRRKRAKAR